jgi:ribose transport system substrate-binding protein
MWLNFLNMNHSKRIIGILFTLSLITWVVVIFFTPLNKSTLDDSNQVSLKIALLLKAKNNAFYDAVVLGAQEQAAKHRIDLTLHYAKNEEDWESQVNFLNNRSSQFDGFIVIPNHSDRFGEPFKNLFQKTKPVVVVDTPISIGEEYILTMVGSNNLVGGKLAGLYILEQIKSNPKSFPCIIMLSGNIKSRTHEERNKGFLEIINTKSPQIPIHTLYAMSSFEKSQHLVKENIDLIEKCGAVFAGSDTMILGLIESFIDESRQLPKLLVGYDSIIEVQRKILLGQISASVQQLPAEMGRAAVQALHSKHFNIFEGDRSILITPRLSVRRFQLETLSEEDFEHKEKSTDPKPLISAHQ